MATILTTERRNALGSLITNWISAQDPHGLVLDTLDYFDVDKIDGLINEAIAPAIADAVQCALAEQAKSVQADLLELRGEMGAKQQPAARYGYARFEDSERWGGDEVTIEEAIFQALTRDDMKMPAPVFVCEAQPAVIDFGSLADEVVERAEEQLYEEVGEVADTLGPFEKSQMSGLAALIKGWFDKHGAISCWKAENIKRYVQGDAEYDAALTRFIAVEEAIMNQVVGAA